MIDLVRCQKSLAILFSCSIKENVNISLTTTRFLYLIVIQSVANSELSRGDVWSFYTCFLPSTLTNKMLMYSVPVNFIRWRSHPVSDIEKKISKSSCYLQSKKVTCFFSWMHLRTNESYWANCKKEVMWILKMMVPPNLGTHEWL